METGNHGHLVASSHEEHCEWELTQEGTAYGSENDWELIRILTDAVNDLIDRLKESTTQARYATLIPILGFEQLS